MVDIVWDTYRPDSSKATTREKRGKRTRRTVLPVYFAGFLQDTTNKEELFNLPTEDVIKHDYPPSKHVYTTSGSHVKYNRADISMSANIHQETDSRTCLHVDDALNDGGNYCSHQNRRHRCGCHLGWNLSRSCPATSWNAVMGRLWQREALPLLPHQLKLPRTWGGKSPCFALVHPFSGSDATAQFSGKGKRLAWKAWKTYPAATAGFTSASQDGFVPLEFISQAFRLIERFTCIMYDSTTSYDKVNDLRQEATIWRNSLKPITAAANPEGFGWT